MIGSNTSVDHIKKVIEQVERLEEQRKDLSQDIKEVFSEAKALGFDVATLKQIIKLRKEEPHIREEKKTLLDTYLSALNGWGNTPLGVYESDSGAEASTVN